MTRTTSYSLPTHPTATGTAPLRRGFSSSSSLLLENPAAPRRVIGTLSAPAPLPGGVPRRWPRAAMLAWAVIVATQLTACSKTVVWEEEVPLNTGEVIWVKRTVEYEYQGGAGNPFDMAYRSNFNELTEFTWGGKKYAYQGDARIMLLAISPRKQPVLVAPADDRGWDSRHKFACVTPYYVQLIPDATGTVWTWPPAIKPWLYGLKANLLLSRHTPEKMTKRYTAEERNGEDGPGSAQRPAQAGVDQTYRSDLCKTQENPW
jgi:hypothetical protein